MSGIYWLASYPKSGNTWFRAFLQNLIHEGDEPADINALKSDPIASARGWLDDFLAVETSDLTQDEIDRLRPHVYDWPGETDHVGYHKIHDAYLLPGSKASIVGKRRTLGAVYILRNPLDVVPSYANHSGVSLDKAITQMADPDHALSGSRRRLRTQVRQFMGTWSNHVQSWVDAPGLNCFVLRYEDMQADPDRYFREAARFLGLPDAPEKITNAVRLSAFSVLAAQEAEKGFRERSPRTDRFFRAGRVGDWRTRLSLEQVERVIADHGAVMARFGYLDQDGHPC